MEVISQRHAPAELYPRKEPPVSIEQEAGWASKLVWTQRLEEKSFASVGDRTPVVQFLVRHYADWATQAPYLDQCESKWLEDVAGRENS
jgi:hypothetical protein